MPFASPAPRSSSRLRLGSHHHHQQQQQQRQYPGGNPPPHLQKKQNPKSESTTTLSSIPKKSAFIRYCCLADLLRGGSGQRQEHIRKKNKKKAVLVVVVGAVHRRRLSPTLVVRERRRRGRTSAGSGKKKKGGLRTSYTGAGAGTGTRTGLGTGAGAGKSARSGIVNQRASSTTTSLRASGVTSVYNPTAPLPPIPQEEEEEGISSLGLGRVVEEEEEEEEDTQASSCPPTAARHPLIIFVRAYKKRRRNQADAEKQDEEAVNATTAADTKTGKHRRSGTSSSTGGGGGGGGGGVGFRDTEDVISPVPRAAHSHQEVRDIVEQGFRRSRRSGDGGVERGVVFGQGYGVWNGPGQQEDEGAAPVIGKIERIMGNPLSNDFYTDRASGSGHSRNNSAAKAAAAKEKQRDSKRHSYPVVSMKNVPLRTSSARPTTAALELDTNLSPVSPDETELSTAHDFSPYSGDSGLFKSLSPPPAAPAAIALRYPNVTALVRANIPGESASKRSSFRSSHRTSNRFSYTQLHDGTNLSDHISSQYSRSKKEQKSPSPIHIEDVSTPDPHPSPPAWAAFGGFAGFGASRNSRSSSSQPSRISTLSSGTEKSAEQSVKSHGHGHRLSWTGRSVLDLDPAPPPVPSKHSPTPPPPPPRIAPSFFSSSPTPSSPTPSSPSRPLRRKDRNIPMEPPTSPPKFATAPRVRTSAFGPYRQRNYPQLPPIPPDPEDVASGQLFLPTLMSRSGSNSKMSVLSVPSTISSFNTINTITRSNTGLSPTPARQYTPRNTPEPVAVAPDAASSRRSIGASTILTETSETSNMTVAELELEMRKIRDRAKRASDERRGSRMRHERSWLAEEEAESSRPGVGHRFF